MVKLTRFRKKQTFVDGLEEAYNASSSNTVTFSSGSVDKSYFSTEDAGTTESRVINKRLYLQGAGGYGECLRAMTIVDDVASGSGGVHGAHLSLDFGTSGTTTGQGIAVRATLMPPAADMGSTNVVYSALQAEIYCPASNDMDSASQVSFIRVCAGGDSTAVGKLEDAVSFVEFAGFTAADGNMIDSSKTALTGKGTIRIKIGSSAYWLLYGDQA